MSGRGELKRADTIATDAIVRVLAPLTADARIRILRAACALLGIPISNL